MLVIEPLAAYAFLRGKRAGAAVLAALTGLSTVAFAFDGDFNDDALGARPRRLAAARGLARPPRVLARGDRAHSYTTTSGRGCRRMTCAAVIIGFVSSW